MRGGPSMSDALAIINDLATTVGPRRRVRIDRLALQRFPGDLMRAFAQIEWAFADALASGKITELDAYDDPDGAVIFEWTER